MGKSEPSDPRSKPPETRRRDAWLPRFKVAVVGDAYTGKTSIVHRIVSNTFSIHYEPTIGLEFRHKKVRYARRHLFLQFWDTSGHDRLNALMPSYLVGTSAALVVYDVTSWTSFMSVPQWVALVRRSCGSHTPIFVLGAKADEAQFREVSTREGCLMAVALGVRFAETSALSGHNIEAALEFEGRPRPKQALSVKGAVQGFARSVGLMWQRSVPLVGGDVGVGQ